MHLLEGRGSCKKERRSATLNRVALTSLKLAAGAAAAVGCAELEVGDPPCLTGSTTNTVGRGEGFPTPLLWEVFRS